MRKSRFSQILLVVLAMGISSCGKPGEEVEITATKERSASRSPVKLDASSEERFQLTAPGPPSAGMALAPFHWTAPQDWNEMAPTQFRMANYRVGPNQEGECYLTVLGGGGGGIFANVNRWRGQMGLAEYTEAEFSELDEKTVLGQPAVYVDFDGTYVGMGGTVPQEDYRLVGILLEYEGQGVFVKMVGPKNVLENERENLDAFLASLHSPAGHTHAAGTGAGETPAEESGADALPAGHPQIGTASPDIAVTSAKTRGQGYRWEAPEGWNQAPDRTMRLVTYTIGETGETECYVTLLGGQGGGLAMNINRWAGQLGEAPLSEAEIDSLPKIEVLGQSVPLFEATGAFMGMDGEAKEGHALLGAACIAESGSVFAKMIGPETEVLAQKDNFVAFCQSLESE